MPEQPAPLSAEVEAEILSVRTQDFNHGFGRLRFTEEESQISVDRGEEKANRLRAAILADRSRAVREALEQVALAVGPCLYCKIGLSLNEAGTGHWSEGQTCPCLPGIVRALLPKEGTTDG